MFKGLATIIVSSLLVACVNLTPPATTPAETSYMARVMAQPYAFEVPADQADEVWGRIQSFIGKYSSMKIQTATDFVIETYNPGNGIVQFGYKAIKTNKGNVVEFSIGCFCGNMFSQKETEVNAHIFSLYAATGEIMDRFIVR